MSTGNFDALSDNDVDEGIEIAIPADDAKLTKVEELMAAASAEAWTDAERLSNKAAEFRRESLRLRAESRKAALQQAEQLDEQAITVQEDCDAARNLAQKLNFDTIVHRLRRNDESLVNVEPDEFYFPHGYGYSLGRSLRKNTTVTKMELDLHSCLSRDCKARLLAAGDKRGSKSNCLDELLTNEIEPSLLHFLSSSTSLRHVSAVNWLRPQHQMIAWKMGDLFLRALAKSTTLLEVHWSGVISAPGLCTLLQSTQSLQTLSVSWDTDEIYPTSEKRSIARAICQTKTLESLSLKGTEQRLIIRILKKLHRARSLRNLCLGAGVFEQPKYDEGFYNALREYLHSAKDTLQGFEMDSIGINDSDVEILLEGLIHDAAGRNNTGCNSVTISRLAFKECFFGASAVKLSRFLQTPLTNDKGETVLTSNLRELSISEHFADRELSQHLAASLYQACVADGNGPAIQLQATIGSQLVTLTVHGIDPIVLEQLSDNALRVSLQELRLDGVIKNAGVAFAKCFPKLTSIRKLTLSGLVPGSKAGILQGLKRNGSVYRVSPLQRAQGDECPFSTHELRLMDAYCKRNRHLKELIQSGRANRAFGPIQTVLLQVAQQVPDSCGSMVVQGLLATSGRRPRNQN